VGELSVGATIELGQRPVAGARFGRPMRDGSDIRLDVVDREDASSTRAHPGPAAYVLEFTAFEAKPWAAAVRRDTVGKASGRIVAMYKAADGYPNAWVAGTFTDAPVEYDGDPPLCAAACAAP
jgi:hypothetical protein